MRYLLSTCMTISICVVPVVAQENVPKAEMTVSVQLYQRTHPRVERVSVYRSPGLILYPAYSDFTADIVCNGPNAVMQTVSADLAAAQANADKAKEVILARVVRFAKDGTSVEQPKPTDAVAFQVTKATDSKDSVKIRVTIPSKAVQWEPGHYRLEFGIWYTDGGAKKTLAMKPVYFEVRSITKGTSDEINLLSNAIMDEVPGLSQRLLADKAYAKIGLAESILALDSHDVLARYALIRKALLVDANPDGAVTLWEAIQKDVEDGNAHRGESLMNPLHTLRPVPVTKETLKSVVADGLKAAKEAHKLSADGKKQVDGLIEKRDYSAVIKLITTGDKATLSSVENVWPALWSIRATKEAKLKAAHEILVKELTKLPLIPSLWQREIVDALASMHNDATHGDLKNRSWDEGIAIIKWWRDHPRLDEGQMPTSATSPSKS